MSDIKSFLEIPENSCVETKLRECCTILKNVVFYDGEEGIFTYQGANVLVLCLEALSFSDVKIIASSDQKTKNEQVKELGLYLFGEKVFNYVKEFRDALFHKRKYELQDFKRFCGLEDKSDLGAFFKKLHVYLKDAHEGILEKLATDPTSRTQRVEFPIKALVDLTGLGKCRNAKPEVLDLFEAWLSTDANCQIDTVSDAGNIKMAEEIEKHMYDFTIEIYADMDGRFGSKRSNQNPLLKHMREERGNYIHTFYTGRKEDNAAIAIRRRHLLLFQMKRTWAFHLYKFHLAIKVYEYLNGPSITYTGLSKTLEETTAWHKDKSSFKVFQMYSKLTDEVQLMEIVTGYVKLMLPVDNNENRIKRESCFPKLDWAEKREIYEEFLLLKSSYDKDSGEYTQRAKELKQALLHRGIDEDTFEIMVNRFIVTDKNSKAEDSIVYQIVKIIRDFCDEGNSKEQNAAAVPTYRNLTFEGVDRIQDNIMDMFCHSGLVFKGFESIEHAFSDSVFVEYLFFMTTPKNKYLSNLLKAAFGSKETGQEKTEIPFAVSYISIFIPANYNFNALEGYITEIVRKLVEFVDKPLYVDCLRKLINFFAGKAKLNPNKSAQNYKSLFKSFASSILASDETNLLNLSHLFHVQKDGKHLLDEECLENVLNYYKHGKKEETEETTTRKRIIALILKLVLTAATQLFQNSNKLEMVRSAPPDSRLIADNGLNLVDRICFGKEYGSLLQELSELDQMCLFNLCVTLMAKVKHNTANLQSRGKLTETHYTEKMKQIREFATSTENLNMLYDAAFQASELVGNHQLAFETYKILFNAILRKSKFAFRYPLGSDTFEKVINSATYQLIRLEGKYADLLNVGRWMAYELGKQSQFQRSVELSKSSVFMYKSVWEHDEMSTVYLVPLAQAYFYHTKLFKYLGKDEVIRCMREGLKYTKLALDISKKKYTEYHPFVLENKLQFAFRNMLLVEELAKADPEREMLYTLSSETYKSVSETCQKFKVDLSQRQMKVEEIIIRKISEQRK